MKVLIALLLVAALLISGCVAQPEAPVAPEPGEPETLTDISGDISGLDQLESDLDPSGLENLETELEDLNW